jgi:hypothetical protein
LRQHVTVKKEYIILSTLYPSIVIIADIHLTLFFLFVFNNLSYKFVNDKDHRQQNCGYIMEPNRRCGILRPHARYPSGSGWSSPGRTPILENTISTFHRLPNFG